MGHILRLQDQRDIERESTGERVERDVSDTPNADTLNLSDQNTNTPPSHNVHCSEKQTDADQYIINAHY